MGIGVLYGKAELLEAMPPYQGGGDMIDQVSFSGTTFASSPQKFEAALLTLRMPLPWEKP